MPIRDDSDQFWAGLNERRLLFQTCLECGQKRFPFRMSCLGCGSFEHRLSESEGRGLVHSYTVLERPLLPGFSEPYTVVLVEVDEGVRYLGLYRGDVDEPPVIGARVRAQLDSGAKVQIWFAQEAG